MPFQSASFFRSIIYLSKKKAVAKHMKTYGFATVLMKYIKILFISAAAYGMNFDHIGSAGYSQRNACGNDSQIILF